MKHIITALVENRPGVLARIVGLISGRGYNIDTLNVGPMPDGTVSRMTITVPGDDRILEQVTKQLNKLVDVIKVTDLTRERHIDRELVLIKVSAPPKSRSEIIELVNLFRAKIIAVQSKSLIIEVTGTEEKVESFLELVKPHGIQEISRSGALAMARE
ncbi:MAG: acetolactate synthase small subunit [Kiritimatiellae bacterium]|nr:acetolactate synthase small subunit [Kiritimatiellia bacterium]